MKQQEGTGMIPGNTGVTIAAAPAQEPRKNIREIFENAAKSKHMPCPVRDILERVSDQWSMLVIYALGAYGTLRFTELKHKIGDVSQRMLTVTLKKLETDGYVHRVAHAVIPPRVDYSLTPLGEGILEQLLLLSNWAVQHAGDIMRHREKAGHTRA